MKKNVFQNEMRIERKNAPLAYGADLYHSLMRLSWLKLFLSSFVIYFLMNLIFGSLYFFNADGLIPKGLDFLDCFFFSVHTFSTVGYGSISPGSFAVQSIIVIETFFGMVSMALMTGLFFSKFSRPSAKFIFSEKLLLTSHNGKKALIFRIANTRSNQVMDARFAFFGLYDEVSPEGIKFRRFVELPLLRTHTPIFALSITGIHEVLPGNAAEGLLARANGGENIEFLISVSGLDDTLGQTIHSSRLYKASSISQSKAFKDILYYREDGVRVIDFENFNQTIE